jgi:hypothetical protein
MKLISSPIFWGITLITMGLIFLLQTLGFLPEGGLLWGIILGLGSVLFLSVFVQDRRHWWALIPGMALLGVTSLLFLQQAAPEIALEWGGSILLGSIGLSFLCIYLVDRQHWWAIIPGGVLLTLAVVAGMDFIVGVETSGVFFLGLGLTFALVALAPNPQGAMWWAWIPAGILLVIGLLFVVAAENMIVYIWPVALILTGGVLVIQALRRGRR